MTRLQILVYALLLCGFALADDSTFHVDRIVVYKQQRKMVLFGHGKEIKQYRIALGEEPVGPKQREGDHRTPEGSYFLDARNAHSQFYKAYHISYPNAEDRETAKKLGMAPGGAIMLHGTPKEFLPQKVGDPPNDWTDGCIAVTNEEMDELWAVVPVGTPIEIKP
jgi:murein L,D-transpeptidase YafK